MKSHKEQAEKRAKEYVDNEYENVDNPHEGVIMLERYAYYAGYLDAIEQEGVEELESEADRLYNKYIETPINLPPTAKLIAIENTVDAGFSVWKSNNKKQESEIAKLREALGALCKDHRRLVEGSQKYPSISVLEEAEQTLNQSQ